MLGQRHRLWPNIATASDPRLMFTGIAVALAPIILCWLNNYDHVRLLFVAHAAIAARSRTLILYYFSQF